MALAAFHELARVSDALLPASLQEFKRGRRSLPLAEFRDYDAIGARVQLDKATGRSRGFGFVMFPDEKALKAAIAGMDKTDMDGRKISVTKAVPQSETVPGTPAAALQAGRYNAGRGYDRYGGGRGGYGEGRYGGGRGYGYGRWALCPCLTAASGLLGGKCEGARRPPLAAPIVLLAPQSNIF